MRYLVFIVLFIIPLFAFSQEFNYVFEPDSIPVEYEGWDIYCPWSGGESESSPELCDIDADNDLDVFVGNFSGLITHYENFGSNSEADFRFITREYAGINLGGNPYSGRTDPVFIDIDDDGDYDLFTSCFRGLVHYWENTGSHTEPEFQWVTDSLEYIQVPGRAHLDFTDIDNDGDYDLFIGANTGCIYFYRNIGTAQIFDFDFVTSEFESIDVDEKAAPCFVDIDNDNDFDLFIGEEDGKIWYYRNDGDSVNYDYTYVTSNYNGIDVGDYSSPEFADIDNDGDYDLFIGREAIPSENPHGDIFFYENTGTPEIPQWEFVTRNYLTLDVSFVTVRAQVVDINGDGSEDIITACHDLTYFENVGTPLTPAFSFVEQGFQGIEIFDLQPYFVDIDNDGDYDLFAGQSAIPGPPSIALYLNNGTSHEPNLELYSANYITNNNFFVNINPVLVDIDGDEDYDLFATDDYGRFYYYRNEGSIYLPNFDLQTFQWIPYAVPSWRPFHFADIDYDGDYDLLIESSDQHNLCLHRNQGTPYSPYMVLETEEFLREIDIRKACSYSVDIDNDGDLDLFCGEQDGGIMFFHNHGYGGGDVLLTLTPHNTPIQIQPGGGFFTFDVEVENVSTTNYVIDFITDATLPNGSSYPIFLRPNITLNAGVTIIRLDIMQAVPGHAPAGEYLYNGYVRDVSTQDTLAVDWFEFTKLTGN